MSLYEVLKASKTERFPDYWTLLWGRKMSASMIKTLTGVLPLTFSTSETKLRDWEIMGNNIGVGERTENLFDKSIADYADTSYINASGIVATTSVEYSATQGYIPVEPNTTYTVKHYLPAGSGTKLALYDTAKTFIKVFSNTASATTFTTGATAAYARFSVITADKNNVMLVKGSTAPASYIPYGYQIPISVNGNEQIFYIGSTPLTAGQSISKTSTGVDIATTEGENTISTTLYNTPEMTIKYKGG